MHQLIHLIHKRNEQNWVTAQTNSCWMEFLVETENADYWCISLRLFSIIICVLFVWVNLYMVLYNLSFRTACLSLLLTWDSNLTSNTIQTILLTAAKQSCSYNQLRCRELIQDIFLDLACWWTSHKCHFRLWNRTEQIYNHFRSGALTVKNSTHDWLGNPVDTTGKYLTNAHTLSKLKVVISNSISVCFFCKFDLNPF